jgi:hypothetical protein
MTMAKCLICERQPRQEGQLYCGNCASKLASERRRSQRPEPLKYATYRGHVVGFYPNGDGKLQPRLVMRDPSKLPQSKTINLDVYCPGFTREQVKKIKRAILALANAGR